jgi:tetratricopeptide (TPR) repeat protein
MQRRNFVEITIITAIFLLFGSCVSSSTKMVVNFDSGPLYGMVYDLDNQPVQSADVTIANLFSARTDGNGRFKFPELSCGIYTITISKESFETTSLTFDFNSPTQVVYARIASLDQLVSRANDEIIKKNYKQAQYYLDRAKNINEHEPVLRYSQAFLYYKQGDTEKALKILESLVNDGFKCFGVYMLFADIYEIILNDIPQAIVYLKEAIKVLGPDMEIEERISKLEKSK